MTSTLSRCLCVGALILGLAGCTPEGTRKQTIHGAVTIQGRPLRSGMVAFHGPGGAYSAGPIKPDGTYTVTDVTPGDFKVAVIETPVGSKGPAPKDPPVPIPEKYRDPESSGLHYTIAPSTTKLDIELK